MSFTDLSTIRKHLVAANIPEQPIENVRITLVGTTDVELPHENLVVDSELVKRFASDVPFSETGVLLTDEDEIPLTNKYIVRDSVTVASDLALTTIYSEEQDYRVNHESGGISRMSIGAIPNSFPVAVWYEFYEQYFTASDYVINHSQGTIRRASGSTIPSGATLLIDYVAQRGAAEDALIDQAIIEAQDVIVRALREGYNASSTDQGLKSGAAYLTLSIVSRGMAALILTRNSGSDANSRAREWQQLSDKWNSAAWNVLAPFVNPHLLRSIVVE